MAKVDSVIEITIEGPKNENLIFAPLGRMLRGAFDLMRDDWPRAAELRGKFGTHRIPGQVLGIDPETCTAWIRDLAAEHPDTRPKIERMGYTLPPARETVPIQPDEVPTWLYWMRRAVEGNLAAVTKGALPELRDITGPVKKHFMSEPQKSPTDRLAEAVEKQNELMAKLLESLAKK